ncbi:GNAT family N-acetyltransferase [Saccharibacillus sp. VR-M41]|uniref:GNAT family N-acetyltransferase n=2 Tax=Saccharibacillus alkalitolerans TaxID=2705290 RepID=A0ABX0F9S9_9BACL|nr:GNAT family N-acetyltransferase [Saccharibacillus alkalitolerans]
MEEQYLPASEVHVCMADGEAAGFVAMAGDYLAALFVDPSRQGHGYGAMLLDRVKSDRNTVTLHVFARNERAAAFYRKQNFEPQHEQIDEATGEREIVMVWRRA